MNARTLLASAVALACAPLARASDWYFTGNYGSGWYTEVWVDLGGGMGYWANNWGQTGPTRPLPYPGSTDDVFFNSIGTASLNNADADVADVSVVSSTLRVENGAVLTVHGASLYNTGVVTIAWGGYGGNGRIDVVGPLTLSGAGQLLFTSGSLTGGTITQSADHLIHGTSGYIDTPLVNYGIVNSDQASGWLQLRGATTNHGTIKASNTARIELRNTIDQGGTGVIHADGGNVYLYSSIAGGTLRTSDASEIQVAGGGVGTVRDLTNEGTLRAPNNNSLLVLAGSSITNNGRIISTENTGMGAGKIRVDSNLTLRGSGELWLRTNLYTTGGFTLTNASGHTIRYGDDSSGSGLLDVPLINEGVIRADYPGKSIVLCTNPKSNYHYIDATNGGSLDLRCTISQESAASIRALGGHVYLNNATVVGGRLEGNPGFEFQAGSNSTNHLVGLHNQAVVRAPNNNSLIVLSGGEIRNDGTLITTENTGMGAGRIRVDSNLTFGGSGELWLRSALFSTNGSTIINAPSHTIRYGDAASGDGLLDVALDNQGVVRSDFLGKTIALRSAAKSNYGIIETTNGGVLSIQCPITQGPSGVIRASGGNVFLTNASIAGGRIDAGSGSEFQTTSNSTNTLSNLTAYGVVRAPNNNSVLVLSGDVITNYGTLITTENTGMGAGQIRIDSNVTLDGSGELWCRTDVHGAAGVTLTNTASHTIRYGDSASGEGRLSVGLLNEGTVRADFPGKVIALTSAPKTNNGLMEATNGGILDLRCVIDQPAGTIAANGGNVRLHGAHVLRGTLTSTGSSLIESVNGTTTTLENVTNAGYVKMWNNNSLLVIRGNLTNHGTIELIANTGMGAGEMRLDNDASFFGSGNVIVKSRIHASGSYPLVNRTGHTISGTGSISLPSVSNQGIVAPGVSAGTLTVNGNFDNTSLGTLRVELASAASYDRLVVNGEANLAGALEILLLGGYLPGRTAAFTVVSASSRTGTFENAGPFGFISVSNAPAGFLPEYAATSVVLHHFTRLGDVNLDNLVDNQDIAGFVALLTGGGVPSAEQGFAADCNHDGNVNNQDIAPFVALLTSGRGIPVGDPDLAPLTNLVPEPATLSLLALGSASALRRRRA